MLNGWLAEVSGREEAWQRVVLDSASAQDDVFDSCCSWSQFHLG